MLAEVDYDGALTYVNELLKTSDKPSANIYYWFFTTKIADDPITHTPIQRCKVREIKELEAIPKRDQSTARKNEKHCSQASNWMIHN